MYLGHIMAMYSKEDALLTGVFQSFLSEGTFTSFQGLTPWSIMSFDYLPWISSTTSPFGSRIPRKLAACLRSLGGLKNPSLNMGKGSKLYFFKFLSLIKSWLWSPSPRACLSHESHYLSIQSSTTSPSTATRDTAVLKYLSLDTRRQVNQETSWGHSLQSCFN